MGYIADPSYIVPGVKYLLDAPDEDMARWRASAKKSGRSFAEWLRLAADRLSLDVALAPEPRTPVVHAPSRSLGGKKTYEPDPKDRRR